MFFIIGISDGKKKFDFVQTIVCKCCGQYGRYEVFMTYTFFSFFFIPLIKWNRHYYVRTSCCNTLYEISEEIGQRIARGEKVILSDSDLILIGGHESYKHCPRCGFTTDEQFDFCPKCGERLD